MELGNLLFGHQDALPYEVPRELEDVLFKFLKEMGFDEYGNIADSRLEDHLKFVKEKGYVFVESDASPDDIRELGDPVEDDTREVYRLQDCLYIIEQDDMWNDDVEEYVLKEELVYDDDFFFENDTFVLRPFYWGDCDTIMQKPNFIYKPENIVINWYKYPLRDASSTVELDRAKFTDVLERCKESLYE